jgi:hypothetical protein
MESNNDIIGLRDFTLLLEDEIMIQKRKLVIEFIINSSYKIILI